MSLPEYDSGAQPGIKVWLQQYYANQFRNHAIDDYYVVKPSDETRNGPYVYPRVHILTFSRRRDARKPSCGLLIASTAAEVSVSPAGIFTPSGNTKTGNTMTFVEQSWILCAGLQESTCQMMA